MSTRSIRTSRIYRFGEFELHVRSGELRKQGEKIRLQEQPYRLLLMLLEHPGEVVLREEIRKRLWPNDTVVEISHGINAAVLRLREALGESAENPRFIETLSRRGYRFTGEVSLVGLPAAAAAPAVEIPQPDTETLSGRSMGHFRILNRLGVGGMGVVYRAEDLKLGREVALKFLPQELAADQVSLTRFQREARTASALNHPNVCTVYSVEDLEGQPAIVMELLDGETLEARLARGAMETGEALDTGAQIAGALEAAHRKGIVHRDLKPGNVVCTPGGVKVLDFGLAKMARGGHVTREGSIVGTPRYMSPEQLLGKEADAASDIYSFGVLLREMLGEGRAIPEGLERVLARCLAREPGDRWRSAADLKAALELVQTGSAAKRRWQIPVPGRRTALAAATSAVVVGLAIAASLWLWRQHSTQRFQVGGPEGVPMARMSLAPDGEKVAFTAGGRVYVREFGAPAARYLEGTENAGSPFWSADSKWVGYVSRGELKKAALRGGITQTLARVNTNLGGTWNGQGEILIGQVGDGLFRVSDRGGDLTRLTVLDRERKEVRHLSPLFLPGGRRFLYVAATERGQHTLCMGSMNGGETVRLTDVESNVAYADGRLLFIKDRWLMAQEFDLDRARKLGEPREIAGPLSSNPAVGSTLQIAQFSAIGKTLAYFGVPGTATALAKSTPVSFTVAPPAITIVRNWAR